MFVEIADTERTREQGLMFRNKLDYNKGMLFVFDKSKIVGFWMKNTYIPLSIAFIDTNYTILQIENMWPMDEKHIYRSYVPIKYALEVNLGWFDNNKVKIGDKINLDN